MAWVLRGYIPAQNRPVAIKILRPELAGQDSARRRFEQEADALQRLQHPNLLPVLGRGRCKELPYLVFPWMSGGTLKDVIDQNARAKTLCRFDQAVR
jgi:serine/threonine-protein kinase